MYTRSPLGCGFLAGPNSLWVLDVWIPQEQGATAMYSSTPSRVCVGMGTASLHVISLASPAPCSMTFEAEGHCHRKSFKLPQR